MYKGRKIAFVASGGGSRGMAHLGVLKACEEIGIEFDLLIGASAGALAVILHSQNPNSDRILDLFRPKNENKYGKRFGWYNMFSFKNFFKENIKSGFFDMQGAEEYFRELLKTDSFDDLKIPTYLAITNLKTGEGNFVGTGSDIPISKALAASCCIPVLFRPVKIKNSFFIDGEIKRPTAVNRACELGADIVIVSDIYKPITSGLEQSNMLKIASQVANMLFEDKSMRGIRIAEDRFPKTKILLVSPKVADFSIFNTNTKAFSKMFNIGHDEANQVFKDYKL